MPFAGRAALESLDPFLGRRKMERIEDMSKGELDCGRNSQSSGCRLFGVDVGESLQVIMP